MPDITLDRARLNPERLTEELRAALGAEAVTGLSWDEQTVTVHLAVPVTSALREAVRAARDAHNPDQPSANQQRSAALRAAREQFREPLDPAAVTLRDLAARVRWLEAELRARLRE